MITVTEQLNTYIKSRRIFEADRMRAALLLLDWTGCAVAGVKDFAGQKLIAAFPEQGGPSIRIGTGHASPLMAALHNGCLGNILEMDDVDKRGALHAGPTVIPAALAVAQQIGAKGDALLDAIIIGYEVVMRLGRAVGAGHYEFWHNTATCGPFGAAAAACHLLKGSDLVSALGLAGTQAAGLWQTRHEPQSMAKQLHCGHAAHAGLLSAILSVQGFQGPKQILEGEQGFFAAMCPGASAQDVLQDYGDQWLIHQTSIKPYPACRHTHAAIDAALEIRAHIKDYDIQDIIVETYDDAVKFCDNPHPKTQIEAKFSIQHCVATILAKGDIQLQDFDLSLSPQAFGAELSHEIPKLRNKVSLKINPEITAHYPAHYGASITIGPYCYKAKDALGDPENPLTNQQIIDKAQSLMLFGGMDENTAKRLIGTCLNLSQGADLVAYMASLP